MTLSTRFSNSSRREGGEVTRVRRSPVSEKRVSSASFLPGEPMPTVLEWKFEGGKDGSQLAARRGKQRVHFGDTVYDEILGEGKALRITYQNETKNTPKHRD